MTLTFIYNGFVHSYFDEADVNTIGVILSQLDILPRNIKDRTISPCYEDSSIYVTLWDTHDVIYQFILHSSYSQYTSKFINKIDDIIRNFNLSL